MIEIYADPIKQNTTIENITAHDPGEVNGVVRVSFEDAGYDSFGFQGNQWEDLVILTNEIIVQNFLNLADGTCMSCQSGSGYTDERCAYCRVYKDIKRCREVTASTMFSQKCSIDFLIKICYNIYVRLRKESDFMKFDRKVIVSVYDLEEAVRMQYDLEDPIEIAPLFWPEDFQNDCLKRLNIEEDDYEWEPETEEATQRQLILTYLRDIFPDETEILVDVSW